MNKYCKKWLISLLSLAMLMMSLTAISSLAQTANTGVITGVVKDQTGAVVAGANIKVINKGTNLERKTTASDSGTFEIPQLAPGDYRFEIDAKGFAKFVQETVT